MLDLPDYVQLRNIWGWNLAIDLVINKFIEADKTSGSVYPNSLVK